MQIPRQSLTRQLVFKRMKSLAQLGHVPQARRTQFPRLALWEIARHTPSTKIDPRRTRYFPLRLSILGEADRLVRRGNSLSPFTRYKKLSNPKSRFRKRFTHEIRSRLLCQNGPGSDAFKWKSGTANFLPLSYLHISVTPRISRYERERPRRDERNSDRPD
jgi:hypothetical protein